MVVLVVVVAADLVVDVVVAIVVVVGFVVACSDVSGFVVGKTGTNNVFHLRWGRGFLWLLNELLHLEKFLALSVIMMMLEFLGVVVALLGELWGGSEERLGCLAGLRGTRLGG